MNRVLAYTSSLDSKRTLKRCIGALLKQSHPVEEILVVDNRSSDGTCLESLPPQVTLLCHLRNLGTSGAAATAFEYALSRGYDWIWVLDQDTVAAPDALEQMVEVHRDLPPERRERVGLLSSTVVLEPVGIIIHSRRLTSMGVRPVSVPEDASTYECDAAIWSGSLFSLEVVSEVGLPRFGEEGCWQDLSLDYGDLEYSFRVKEAGYEVLGCNRSRIVHPVGRAKHLRLWGQLIYSTNHSPFRRYLYFRNMVFFWLYLHPRRSLVGASVFLVYRFLANSLKVVLMEEDRGAKLWAGVIGSWHGLRRRLDERAYYGR